MNQPGAVVRPVGALPAGVRTLDAQRQWIVQEMDHFGVRLNLEGLVAG